MFKQALLLSKDSVGLVDPQGVIHVSQQAQTVSRVLLTQKYLVLGGHDKVVRVFANANQHYSLSLPKKIKRIIQLKEDILVSDKHGDIYEISGSELQLGSQVTIKSLETEPRSSNLAIPKYMGTWKVDQKQVIVLGDDYCKIKVINAANIDEILNVVIPIEGLLKQIVEVGADLYWLFKIIDENNSDTHFKVMQLPRAELFNDQAPFKLVFPLDEKQALLSRSEKLRIARTTEGILVLITQQGEDIVIQQLNNQSTLTVLQKAKLQSVQGQGSEWYVVGESNDPQYHANERLVPKTTSRVIDGTVIHML